MALVISNLQGAKITEFELPGFISAILNTIFLPLIFILKKFLLFIGGRDISYDFFSVIHVSVGILSFPILFLITDMIEEVYGKRKTLIFITTGVIALSVMVLLTTIAVYLPAAERSIDNDAFTTIFKSGIRISIASIIAFFFGQMHDLWSFSFWKKFTKGKHLWFRNNVSTIFSQLIDSTIFMFLAFYQITPKFDVVFIISLIIPYWIFKILFAMIDTPFCYLGVWWLRGKKKKPTH